MSGRYEFRSEQRGPHSAALGLAAVTTLAIACVACSSPPGVPDAAAGSFDQIRRACVLNVACGGNTALSTRSGTDCYWQLTKQLVPGLDWRTQRDYDCARQATNCTDEYRCLSLDHDATYCAAHPGQSCDGDVAVECLPGQDWANNAIDCRSLGMHCVQSGTETGCATNNPCSLPRRCDGNRLIDCYGDYESVYDCSTAWPSWTCEDLGRGAIDCVPPGPSCTPNMTRRCDGNVLVACTLYHEVRIDCAALFNGTCDLATLECTSGVCNADSPDRCHDANSIDICTGGQWTTTPCSSVGMRTCGPLNDGTPRVDCLP